MSDANRCIAAGADGYLTKPVDLQQFYQVLVRFLRDDKQRHSTGSAYVSDEFIDDPEFLELVRQFVTGLPETLAQINAAIEQKEWDHAQLLSHNLKGIGGNYGFPSLSYIAQQINSHLKNKQYQDLDQLLLELEKECQRIADADDKRRAS